jgi:hypothetical protein
MIRRFHISERQQVALIIFVALLGIFLVWSFLLRPQISMRRENAEIRDQLENSRYANLSMESLREVAALETAAEKQLQEEWAATRIRLGTFSNQDSLRKADVARIDYKVELFNTRQRLQEKSKNLGIALLPTDLGIDEELKTNDRVRDRMLQLKAVDYLADLALDNRIQQLVSITPLASREHPGADGKVLFTEYPVQVTFDADFVNLYQLFQSVFEENRLFVFNSIRVVSGPSVASMLRVQAVMSALVFE